MYSLPTVFYQTRAQVNYLSSQERAAPEGNVPDQSGSSKKTVFKEDSFDPLLPQFTFATILKNKNKIVSAYEEGVYNNNARKRRIRLIQI